MNEIFVYGNIFDTFAADFANELSKCKGDIKVRINSLGGDIFQAIAIYNLLKEYAGKVEVVIDGLCASAATILMLGADKIAMQKNALLMIHLPTTVLSGDFKSEELQKFSNELSAIEKIILETYKTRCQKSDKEILQMMKAETWLTAEQAKETGFIDEIYDQVVVNMFAKPSTENILDKFIARIAAKLKAPEKVEKPVEKPAKSEKQIAEEYLLKMMKDNVTCGASGVTGSVNLQADRKRQAQMIAKFAK